MLARARQLVNSGKSQPPADRAVEESQEPLAPGRGHELLRQRRVQISLLVVGAAAIFGITWLVVNSDTFTKSEEPAVIPVGPVGLSASGMQTLGNAVGQPIYWVGPKPGYLYELTRTSEGNVYIRYLPPGVDVGAKAAKYLVVVTYPYKNAFDALENVANGKEIEIPDGGIALVNESSPRNVHVAFPNEDYQVEIYDPSPARSLEVARSGAVRPAH